MSRRQPHPFHPAFFLLAWILATAPAGAWRELVLHKEGTKLYHRPHCPVVRDGAGVLALDRAQAESRGYKAHPDCDPANAPPPAAKPPARAPAPVTVYVDGSKYYHRKDCRRLNRSAKEFTAKPLDSAGREQWPCPSCRPPVRRRPAERPPQSGRGR